MTDWNGLRWLNPPDHFEIRDGDLAVRTGERTDFWRDTFYGFRRDSGHFLHRRVEGDFSAEVTVNGRYETLYDQAGLMARLDESRWVKAGIEYTDGEAFFSVVVTNGMSDWSLRQVPAGSSGQRLRLTRHGEAIRVQFLDADTGQWTMARLAHLPPTPAIDVGVMCCSPQRRGFEVTFRDMSIGPAISRELHG